MQDPIFITICVFTQTCIKFLAYKPMIHEYLVIPKFLVDNYIWSSRGSPDWYFKVGFNLFTLFIFSSRLFKRIKMSFNRFSILLTRSSISDTFSRSRIHYFCLTKMPLRCRRISRSFKIGYKKSVKILNLICFEYHQNC